MSLLVVIVNYRTADLAIDCLASLEPELRRIPDARAVVVDNASGDGSAERLGAAVAEHGWGAWARVMPQSRNGGFAFGNNAAVRPALDTTDVPEFFFFLNPDTNVRPGAVTSIVEFFRANPRAGAVGSALRAVDDSADVASHLFPSPATEFRRGAGLNPCRPAGCLGSSAHQCDWVTGAAMAVRREALQQAGLFDEGFFLYFEEVDLCRRIGRSGWEIWHLPQSVIVHLEGAASGINRPRVRRGKAWFESRRRFLVKHYGVAGLVVADGLWAIGRASLLARRLFRLSRAPRSDPRLFAVDLLWGDLAALCTGRAGVREAARS